MDVAYAVLVKVAEGQGLDVVKAGLAHITVHLHFGLVGVVTAPDVDESLKQQKQEVACGKRGQGVQRARTDVVSNSVVLEKREDGVDSAGERHADDHGQQQLFVRLNEREDGRDAEPFQMGVRLFSFLLHRL